MQTAVLIFFTAFLRCYSILTSSTLCLRLSLSFEVKIICLDGKFHFTFLVSSHFYNYHEPGSRLLQRKEVNIGLCGGSKGRLHFQI